MKQIDMIKAFAKLEGFNQVEIKGRVQVSRGFNCDIVYNPITDLALNCAARDKYKVEVSYDYNMVTLCLDDGLMSEVVHFKSIESIPSRVIECILKSKGLYK